MIYKLIIQHDTSSNTSIKLNDKHFFFPEILKLEYGIVKYI